MNRNPIIPFGWFHVCITWSEVWGLKYYENGRLVREQVNFEWRGGTDEYTRVEIGKPASRYNIYYTPITFQISELVFWYDFLSQEAVKEKLILSGKYHRLLSQVRTDITSRLLMTSMSNR